MINLVLARGSTTGQLLHQMLVERGVEIGQPAQAVVSYGVPLNTSLPALNRHASRIHKFDELMVIREAGLPIPPVSLDGSGLQFPILGRKFRHSKGRDIIPILQNDQEFQWRKDGKHSDFFVQYIPRATEYRVWMYRRQPLAVYEKVMRYPERYGRIGCNFENGFAFQFVPKENRDSKLVELGERAVEAMQYDFGAVDILKGKDNMLYVLEVNSAPGQETARTGLTRLADKIAKWVELGFPRRNGDT
jgi:hypothetical protein